MMAQLGPTTLITWIGVSLEHHPLSPWPSTQPKWKKPGSSASTSCPPVLFRSGGFQKFLGKLFHATQVHHHGSQDLLQPAVGPPPSTQAPSPWAQTPERTFTGFTCFLGQFNGVTLIKPSVAQPRHSRGFLLTGGWRSLLGTGILQDPLLRLPPSFWLLHLQP